MNLEKPPRAKPMPLHDLLALFGAWQTAMLKLGFEGEEISYSANCLSLDNELGWGLVLETQGTQWAMFLGNTDEEIPVIASKWAAFVDTTDDDAREAIFQAHVPSDVFHDALASIERAGIRSPFLEMVMRDEGASATH